MDNKDVIGTLNKLIETSRDGDKGFTNCAEESKDAALKAYFTICATRCRESVRTLDQAIKKLGGTAETSGTIMGSANRAWLDLRVAIESNSDLAVLTECERAEDVALKNYLDALKQPLPNDIYTLVQAQCDGVRMNHDRVRSMRDDKKLVTA